MNVQLIKTEDDYRATLREIEALMDAAPGSEAEDRLDLLATLVQAYEAKHYPILPPDPVEAILYRMECLGLSRQDLEPYIGSRGRVSEVLSRKRPLTMEMIRQLHDHLDIPADILIRPYPIHKTQPSTKAASV